MADVLRHGRGGVGVVPLLRLVCEGERVSTRHLMSRVWDGEITSNISNRNFQIDFRITSNSTQLKRKLTTPAFPMSIVA